MLCSRAVVALRGLQLLYVTPFCLELQLGTAFRAWCSLSGQGPDSYPGLLAGSRLNAVSHRVCVVPAPCVGSPGECTRAGPPYCGVERAAGQAFPAATLFTTCARDRSFPTGGACECCCSVHHWLSWRGSLGVRGSDVGCSQAWLRGAPVLASIAQPVCTGAALPGSCRTGTARECAPARCLVAGPSGLKAAVWMS